MNPQAVETGLTCCTVFRLRKRVHSPVLVTLLHLLECFNNVLVADLLSGIKTLLEISPTRVDWLPEDHDLTERSEVAQQPMEVVLVHG
jgi:hypothetical protein